MSKQATKNHRPPLGRYVSVKLGQAEVEINSELLSWPNAHFYQPYADIRTGLGTNCRRRLITPMKS